MAKNGMAIQAAFKRVLDAAFSGIREFNSFVTIETLPPIELHNREAATQIVNGTNVDENRLEEVRQAIAQQFFQDQDHLKHWIDKIDEWFGSKPLVKEALAKFRDEQSKPSLWTISDRDPDDSFPFTDKFLKKTLKHELSKRFRLDCYSKLAERDSLRNTETDRVDFENAVCIVISRSDDATDSVARHLIDNILHFASDAASEGRKLPFIVLTAATCEQALAFEKFVREDWGSASGRAPFLFLIPSDDPAEIKAQKIGAKAFFEAEQKRRTLDGPPEKPKPDEKPKLDEKSKPDQETESDDGAIAGPQPAAENDLVVLLGGKLTTAKDGERFDQLKSLLGQHEPLIVVEPWPDPTSALVWNFELERKLDAAKHPLLIEHIGEAQDRITEKSVFATYVVRAAVSRLDDDPGIVERLPSLTKIATKQRLAWKPAGAEVSAAAGIEVSSQEPSELAQLILGRLGLSEETAQPTAYVAVEEVIVNRRLDGKLRSALKENLSKVVGGTGLPPSTDCVVPFPFKIVPGSADPLHRAVQKFKPKSTNIVAACDASRGGRTLKQYLTEINARVRDGVNTYFRNDLEQLPGCILRIVVMIDEKFDQPDMELFDNADGSWRVIKFKRLNGEYSPDGADLEAAQAWVNDQMASRA